MPEKIGKGKGPGVSLTDSSLKVDPRWLDLDLSRPYIGDKSCLRNTVPGSEDELIQLQTELNQALKENDQIKAPVGHYDQMDLENYWTQTADKIQLLRRKIERLQSER